MKAFSGLLWKDFNISKVWFFGWITIVFVIYLLAFGLGEYFNEPAVVLPFVVMLGFFHFAFIPVLIYSMLRVEGKTQLWLHSPHSGVKLLLSKMVIAFLYSSVSLLIVDGLGLLSLSWQKEVLPYLPWKEGIFFNLGVMSSSIYLGCWLIFYWTFYHFLGKFPQVKNFRWLLLVGIFIGYQFLSALMIKVKWFMDIYEGWTINVSRGFFLSGDPGNSNFEISSEAINIPIIPFISYFIVMVSVFYLSSWLLDRKVEV